MFDHIKAKFPLIEGHLCQITPNLTEVLEIFSSLFLILEEVFQPYS
jgi:hypothetical protein